LQAKFASSFSRLTLKLSILPPLLNPDAIFPMPLNIVLMFVLALAWATAFPWIKIAVADLGPLTIVASRLTIGAVLLVIYRFAVLRQLGFSRAHLKPFLIMAVIGNVLPFSLITFGQQHVPSGATALIVGTVPLFTLMFTHLMLRQHEPVTLFKLSGALLAVAGVGLLMGPELDPSAVAGSLLPYLMVLGGPACYGFMNVYGRLNTVSMDSTTLATGMVVTSAAVALPLAAVFEHPWQTFGQTFGSQEAWLAVLGLGVVPTALATLLYFPTLRRGGALAGAVAGNLVPVFGVLLSALLVEEPLTRTLALGGTLILAGVVCTQAEMWQRAVRQR
jgi:drug/metabolite transporter (DMT)-like permease